MKAGGSEVSSIAQSARHFKNLRQLEKIKLYFEIEMNFFTLYYEIVACYWLEETYKAKKVLNLSK